MGQEPFLSHVPEPVAAPTRVDPIPPQAVCPLGGLESLCLLLRSEGPRVLPAQQVSKPNVVHDTIALGDPASDGHYPSRACGLFLSAAQDFEGEERPGRPKPRARRGPRRLRVPNIARTGMSRRQFS